MMINGIRAALDFPHDPERLRFVCFLTDGYIGNEAEILGEIDRRLGASRIFSFGVGTSVNRWLIDQMARFGRGAVAHLGPNDSGAEVMDRFIERIRHAALTDLRVDWGGLEVSEVFPLKVPDLFPGRPVVLAGRYRGQADFSRVKVTGTQGGSPVEVPLGQVDGSKAGAHAGLPSVWARMNIAHLADESIRKPSAELPGQIKKLALNYSLLSPYTAFVAVDSTRATAGTEGVTVPVAVPVPEGVKYETTVQP
jgi:Ca-activated chloride channel family protein